MPLIRDITETVRTQLLVGTPESLLLFVNIILTLSISGLEVENEYSQLYFQL